MNIFFLIIMALTFPLMAEPWGKDADLAHYKPHTKMVCSPPSHTSSALTQFGVKAIKFHQEIISPADGPRSHYIPSSSQYTLEAMCKHGFFKGFIMGCDRLMRENDEEWVYRKIADPRGCMMKWDPVP